MNTLEVPPLAPSISGASAAPRPIEQMALLLVRPPWHGLYLVPAGLVMYPLYDAIWPRQAPWWGFAAVFCLVLTALRAAGAILRMGARLSRPTRLQLQYYRGLAKRFDSFQWQKLLWVGLGMVLQALLSPTAHRGHVSLALAVTAAGAVGRVYWRHQQRVLGTEAPSK